MPSEQYSLELTNTIVGRLDPQRSRVTGLVVGYTEAVLQDKSILFYCVQSTAATFSGVYSRVLPTLVGSGRVECIVTPPVF